MAVVLPPFVETLPDGVERLSLPTPFRVGRVNCYLLAASPVTLIDPGTIQPGAIERLASELAARGLGFADIEQIVVTHAHPDHFGAAAELATRSGASIVCGPPEVPGLLGPPDAAAERGLLTRLGVPEPTAHSLAASGEAMLGRAVVWPDPSSIRGVRDGGVLTAGGRQLVCMVTPGHADGHLSLWDPADRTLFSGDHLLARIVPVPSLNGGDPGTQRRRAFVEYLEGLDRFAQLDPAVVLPGHGRGFTALELLVRRLRDHSRARAGDIAAILRDGPASPFDIALRLQWQPEGARLVLGLANAQGHLDLLEQAGRATVDSRAEVVRYRLSS
jgi:glyoxylase-like metal-dependent hydrolase (beta-lactamase superfamily II)